MQLRVVCPRLGVRVAVDDRRVSLQLLRCGATVQGSAEVAAAVGTVRLALDDDGDDGDDSVMLQVYMPVVVTTLGAHVCLAGAGRSGN